MSIAQTDRRTATGRSSRPDLQTDEGDGDGGVNSRRRGMSTEMSDGGLEWNCFFSLSVPVGLGRLPSFSSPSSSSRRPSPSRTNERHSDYLLNELSRFRRARQSPWREEEEDDRDRDGGLRHRRTSGRRRRGGGEEVIDFVLRRRRRHYHPHSPRTRPLFMASSFFLSFISVLEANMYTVASALHRIE